MTTPDYSTWLTKQQAADAIGVTTKSVERFVQAGQIQQARWQREGRGPLLAVYEPSDVARIASERRQGPLPPFVVPASAGSANGNGHEPRALSHELAISKPEGLHAGTTPEELLHGFMLAIARAVSETTSETSSTLFLTIDQTAVVSGLPAIDLRRAIEAGELPARKTGRGGYRIRRKDLEQL